MFNRHLERLMGMAAGGNSLFAASAFQVHRFENALAPGSSTSDGYDRVYVPQIAWTTGDIDVHDIGISGDDRPVFVSTLFSCIATVSDTHSFEPLWQPKWITRLAAEDRCHLNGLAMQDGAMRFAGSVSTSDTADGWRDHRRNGGVIVDIASGEIAVAGLSMPHSPRLYRDRLWLHNSGTGEFGSVDLDAGRFEPAAFCPGYLRGLDFIGDFAVMGLSMPRGDRAMSDLALYEALIDKAISAR